MTLRPADILKALPASDPRRKLVLGAMHGSSSRHQEKDRRSRISDREKLERRFLSLWRGPAPTPQYRFDPGRKWRLDFAWPAAKVAVEVHGGTWSGGRHTRGSGFARDREKMNRAMELGWHVWELTGDQVTAENVRRIRGMIEATNPGDAGKDAR
jgi:hypothetical protein